MIDSHGCLRERVAACRSFGLLQWSLGLCFQMRLCSSPPFGHNVPGDVCVLLFKEMVTHLSPILCVLPQSFNQPILPTAPCPSCEEPHSRSPFLLRRRDSNSRPRDESFPFFCFVCFSLSSPCMTFNFCNDTFAFRPYHLSTIRPLASKCAYGFSPLQAYPSYSIFFPEDYVKLWKIHSSKSHLLATPSMRYSAQQLRH